MISHLPTPPPGYMTLGPWLASYEWRDGGTETRYFPNLDMAIIYFYDAPQIHGRFSGYRAPDRRVVVDARGVIILGCERRGDTFYIVVTEEVFAMHAGLGIESEALLDLEMELYLHRKET